MSAAAVTAVLAKCLTTIQGNIITVEKGGQTFSVIDPANIAVAVRRCSPHQQFAQQSVTSALKKVLGAAFKGVIDSRPKNGLHIRYISFGAIPVDAAKAAVAAAFAALDNQQKEPQELQKELTEVTEEVQLLRMEVKQLRAALSAGQAHVQEVEAQLRHTRAECDIYQSQAGELAKQVEAMRSAYVPLLLAATLFDKNDDDARSQVESIKEGSVPQFSVSISHWEGIARIREHLLCQPLTYFTNIPSKLNDLGTAYHKLPGRYLRMPAVKQRVALVQAQLTSALNWWQHERDIRSLDTVGGSQGVYAAAQMQHNAVRLMRNMLPHLEQVADRTLLELARANGEVDDNQSPSQITEPMRSWY